MIGIDVSHFQNKIDWIAVSKSIPKLDFVYIKSSTGVGSADPKSLYNAVNAKKNGLKIGYYHYCSLNNKDDVQDAKDEAKWFAQVLKMLPYPDLPVVLDIEDEAGAFANHLTPAQILEWITTFFATLPGYGLRDYALYSYQPFLDEHLPPNHGLGNIKLWVAQYRSVLTLPKGWSSAWLWQYDNAGTVSGINTKVDLNKQ